MKPEFELWSLVFTTSRGQVRMAPAVPPMLWRRKNSKLHKGPQVLKRHQQHSQANETLLSIPKHISRICMRDPSEMACRFREGGWLTLFSIKASVFPFEARGNWFILLGLLASKQVLYPVGDKHRQSASLIKRTCLRA